MQYLCVYVRTCARAQNPPPSTLAAAFSCTLAFNREIKATSYRSASILPPPTRIPSVVKSDSAPVDEQKRRRIDRSAARRYLSRPRLSLSSFSPAAALFSAIGGTSRLSYGYYNVTGTYVRMRVVGKPTIMSSPTRAYSRAVRLPSIGTPSSRSCHARLPRLNGVYRANFPFAGLV